MIPALIAAIEVVGMDAAESAAASEIAEHLLSEANESVSKAAGLSKQRAAEIIKEEVERAIKEAGIVATGTFLNSIEISEGASSTGNFSLAVDSSDTNMVVSSTAPYALVIEEGRRAGVMPNVADILDWMEIKNIPATMPIAYAIARKISEQGIEGKHPFRKGLEAAESRINEEMEKIAEQSVQK